MYFDDRLATVLGRPFSGEVIAPIQYRQLLDLLGTAAAEAGGQQLDSAYLRLAEIAAAVPPQARAGMLAEQSLRLRNPRLVAQLACAEPTASAAIDAADLTVEQWQDLIPALSAQARGFLWQRDDLASDVRALLSRLGVHDRGRPPADSAIAGQAVWPDEAPAPVSPPAPP